MLLCFAALLLATLLIQIPNLIGIQALQTSGQLSLWTAAKISFYTLPITWAATWGYTLFYGRGSDYFSYPMMSVYAKVAALVVAFVIQGWLLKYRETTPLEWLGVALCLGGFLIAVFHRELTELLG